MKNIIICFQNLSLSALSILNRKHTFSSKLHYWAAFRSRVVGSGTYRTNIDRRTRHQL